jgi:amidase
MTSPTDDNVNAFISRFTIAGAADGPLAGLTFGAKDLFDIAGHVTGCGNPDWARTHPAAALTAPAILALLDAGATLAGKTHTDELAYSLMGVNAHYGTPLNSAAPDRVPGGSSSGSAAAVTAGLVDIGLGSDTGGSVRLPASFCGLYGIRTTHGRISLDGAMPLAPGYDTAGWFARDGATFARTGEAYGITSPESLPPLRLMVATDAMALASPETRAAMDTALSSLQSRFGPTEEVILADTALADWRETFRICQAAEIWLTHGDWIRATNPDFGPGVKERFEMAAGITPEMLEPATARRAEIRKRLRDMLGDDGILILPTAPGPAPRRDADEAGLNSYRNAALELLCAAGHAGLPQVSLPAGSVDGGPVGLSIVANAGRDGLLLAIARDLDAG